MTIWDKPWPDAPLRDRVLMMCAQTEDGWERDQLASRLHMPGVLLGRTLTHLVNDGWLKVAHQYGGLSGASVYTIDSRRAGLREMKTLWHLEHGFVSGEPRCGLWTGRAGCPARRPRARFVGPGRRARSGTRKYGAGACVQAAARCRD